MNKDGSLYRLDHFRVEGFQTATGYRPPARDMSEVSVARDRSRHAPRLQAELAQALQTAKLALDLRRPEISQGDAGVYLQVESQPGGQLPDLNWSSKGLRLGAVRRNEHQAEVGAWFVPESAEGFLDERLQEYATGTTAKGEAKQEKRFAPLETVTPGTLETLWNDKRALPEPDQSIWWECWCWSECRAQVLAVSRRLGLRASDRFLRFPELEVVLLYANIQDIRALLQNCSGIEELRRANDSPRFFMAEGRKEQSHWVGDLLARLQPPPANAPAVCLLDHGVAVAHPLLKPAISAADCFTLNSSWGVDDHHPHGHGTNMAGTILYGDLTYPLADQRSLQLEFRLESLKFSGPPAPLDDELRNFGSITQAAVSLAESHHSERCRLFCMAVTNEDVSGEVPSSWSSALDQICSGSINGLEDGERKRLFFVSAGNIPDSSDPDEISDADEFPIEDPAQAWNALCVGGFTDKDQIDDNPDYAGWTPLAEVGDRSPYSRVSTDWSANSTPIKPEIVFEAGNRALNASGTEILAGMDGLSLLTTHREFLREPVTTFWATSAATAQAAGMAATIMARAPELWPETIRALMVHSAEWTPSMLRQLEGAATKKEAMLLTRQFGYGVPSLERALNSAQNDLALVAQTEIQPFRRHRKVGEAGKTGVLGPPTLHQIHYYELPWPKQALEQLFNEKVALKITLSYFVEPNPGQNAPVRPERYQSFGLRFDLRRKSETPKTFKARINQLEKGELPALKAESDNRWTFGSKSRNAGSLHCDVWTGPAIDLVTRDTLAIYPVGGWWKTNTRLNRYNCKARYALVVSITSADAEVDLYTEIANQIQVTNEISV